jgi:hypothetical protein
VDEALLQLLADDLAVRLLAEHGMHLRLIVSAAILPARR